jgi:hypothetical protein
MHCWTPRQASTVTPAGTPPTAGRSSRLSCWPVRAPTSPATCAGATSTSPTPASTSAAQRPKPAYARSPSSCCCATTSPPTKPAPPTLGPGDLVFPTNTGGLRDKDNLRNRVLAATITRADELLAHQGHPPLPAGLTPHKLRHTFASILVATGEDPASVMAQLGHTDAKFTLRVYTHLMPRDPEERARLNALVAGETPTRVTSTAARESAVWTGT